MLTLRITAYWCQKAGTPPRCCEDAFAYDAGAGLAAIADGASDAFEARMWARQLVTAFVRQPPAPQPTAFRTWLDDPEGAWHSAVRWEELPWYAAQKAREVGGLATFLGFRLQEDDPPAGDAPSTAWRAMAVGDACLLHVRGRSILTRFPVERTDGFGTTPHLLSTCRRHTDAMLKKGGLRQAEGRCRAGDVFLLATDALAQWLYGLPSLEAAVPDMPDWERLSGLIEESFPYLIEHLRERSTLRNDDVTLLVLRIVPEQRSAEAAGNGGCTLGPSHQEGATTGAR